MKNDFKINILIEKGIIMEQKVSNNIHLFQKKLVGGSLFINSIVTSLTWSGHAKNVSQYYSNSIKFLDSNEESFLENAIKNSERQGEEKLRIALKSWLIILKNFGHYDFSRIRAKKISILQENLWKLTSKLINKNKIRGIGNWLLFAPFKIIITYRIKLWNNNEIDNIKKPLGIEVIRGIKKLIKRNSKYTSDYDINIFDEKDRVF